MNNGLLAVALEYSRLNWSVIPLRRDKKPLVDEWTPYQHRRATENEITSWWKKWPQANVGIVTGAVSGLVVIDADSEKALERMVRQGMPPTPQASTGKGTHFYFRHPRLHVPNKVDATLGLDVRADGGYVMAPPSLHPSGKRYEWGELLSPWDTALAELLPWMLEYIDKGRKKADGKPQGWQTEALKGVAEGGRNQTAASLAGRYISKGLNEEEVVELLLLWNERNSSPLPDAEIRRTVQSVHATHERNHPPRSEVDSSSLQFPKVISGLAGDFADLYSSYLEVPAHFLFMSFLTCLGSVLANRLTLSSEVAPQPRLYVILLGESADDRKSTALVKVVDFFQEGVTDFGICWGVGSAEGLQKRLQENGRLLLCFDEFKLFVSKCKIETSVLLPAVNSLFESNRYESRTKGADIRLEDAYLSLLGASTVQTYERIWDSSFTDIGFNNRLFLVPGSGERKHSIPAKVPQQERQMLKTQLGQVLRYVGDHLELELTSTARKLYDQWYMDLERSIHAKRLDTYALRFMALLAANEKTPQVDEGVVGKAIALADWQLSVRRLHDPIDADNKIAGVEVKIRRILGQGPKNDRDLKRAIHVERMGLWYFTKSLGNLRAAGEIRWNKSIRAWELI